MGSPWNWVLVLGGGVKNYNDAATRPNKKFDDIFIRLNTIHQLDRQTDRQTDRRTDGQTPGHSKDRAYA